ncbi:hypothetical protein PISMIDRAFT_183750 [Pisolithus microcarpus 441]|uniref:Uncharacterized protein n=1 Tax=Pisolithus microcarpus 441 TaxID=765257 RepID=A0A0C9ZN94_9AGAM|nr:hypothetical protein PISMIDRAFT_183750 [Pisolithus microcarpus 441]
MRTRDVLCTAISPHRHIAVLPARFQRHLKRSTPTMGTHSLFEGAAGKENDDPLRE